MKKERIVAAVLAGLLMAGAGGRAFAEWQEETKGGKVIRRSWTDESGKAAVSPEGYAEVTCAYNGTSVTEKYFDLAGEPAPAIGGYYGQILTYGNKHRLEEIVYLDADGAKTECAGGYARVKMAYTAAGGVTTAGYYDAENHLTVVPGLGYAQVKNDYRGTTLTRTSYFDENKKPIDTPMGYAVMIQSVNKSNRVTGISFEHADGSPAACTEGWAVMKRELDKKNREVSVRYYDLAGSLVDRGLGYAYEIRKWESDEVYTFSRYNLQDQQIALGEGIASIRREMNGEGQVVKETYLDASGNIAENGEGVAARKYEYDGAGRLTKVMFEGSRGQTAENAAGYAGYQEKLDGDGFVLNRVYLGKNGSPVNTAGGYSEIRYLYDSARQVSRTEYYDVNGALVKQE